MIRLLRASGQSEANARRDAKQLATPGAYTAALNWYRAMPLAPWRQLRKRVQAPTLLVWRHTAPGRGVGKSMRPWSALRNCCT